MQFDNHTSITFYPNGIPGPRDRLDHPLITDDIIRRVRVRFFLALQ